MSREYKFRAWIHADCGGGVPQECFNTMAYSENDSLEDFFSQFENFFDIMQYTGHKDKNGKEIYEDDCFELNYLTRWIEWDQENCCYNINSDEAERGQVTANKHENPELV